MVWNHWKRSYISWPNICHCVLLPEDFWDCIYVLLLKPGGFHMVKRCKDWSCINLWQALVSTVQDKGEKTHLNINSCFILELSTTSGRWKTKFLQMGDCEESLCRYITHVLKLCLKNNLLNLILHHTLFWLNAIFQGKQMSQSVFSVLN